LPVLGLDLWRLDAFANGSTDCPACHHANWTGGDANQRTNGCAQVGIVVPDLLFLGL